MNDSALPDSTDTADRARTINVNLDMSTRTLLRLLLAGALFYGLVQVVLSLGSFFVSLTVAGFLAISADPVIRALDKRGMSRGVAVAVFMTVLVIGVGLMTWVFAAPLIDQGTQLSKRAPGIVEDAQHSKLLRSLDQRFDIVNKGTEQLKKLPSKIAGGVGATVGVVLSGVASTITILFMMILMLLGGGDLIRGTVHMFPQLAERRWWSIVQGAYRSIAAYVASTLLIAFIAGSVIVISLLALGIDFALPLGLWMLLLDIIPLIGATIGALPAVLVAFTTGGVTEGVIMLVIVIVYQQLENNLLQPAIQGKIVSLSALSVFMSVLIGAQLMGVLGALLAVPLAGILKILYVQHVESIGGHEIAMPALAPDDAPEAPNPNDPLIQP